MLASHEWLRGFVPHALQPAEIERLLSTHVATVDSVQALRADLEPIVVARVTWADRHPDSDHLWVTKVDDGSGVLLDVVCGAPNVVVGTLYPFARVGVTIPTGIKLDRRKIRGEYSNGMLCSARELKLGDDHLGIMALDVNVAPGTPFLEAVPVGDVRYEIDVLPNRPDLLCHAGIARELSALTGVAMQNPPELAALAAGEIVATGTNEGAVDGVSVRIENAEGCPRYAAAIIRGLKVGPSPDWLKARLESLGLRPISNIVDITNYFLHGFGQPMHAFDLGRLDGPAIVVRRANAGEKLTTLDGVARTLTSDMLVIADSSKAAAVAGVIGGADTQVTDGTTDVLLEVACFDARSVRQTRRALGVNTDASHRFERGTDPESPARITALAASLIASLGGGRVAGAVLAGLPPEARPRVEVRPARVTRLLGAKVSADEVAARLRGIGFVVSAAGNERLNVIAPSWRHDVSRDVDIIEEIARLRGYDTLSNDIKAFNPGTSTDDPLYRQSRRVRDALASTGFSEVRPLPFVSGAAESHIRVTNPLAEDEPYLRSSILDTLSRRAEYNLGRRQGDLRLFEIGSVWPVRSGGEFSEESHVGVLLMGATRPVHFTKPEPAAFDFWDAKALAERVAEIAFPGSEVALEPGEGRDLWTIRVSGAAIGGVKALTLDAPPWASPAFGIELKLRDLSARAVAAPGKHAHAEAAEPDVPKPRHRYVPLPTMPAAEFDLAFLVPDEVPASSVENTIRRTGGDLLERVVLFDEFTGSGVPEGQRSLAWRLTFRHPERTLNEKELAGRRQKLIATVEKEHGVVARTG
jgi:phenylalanyl-tRNA synthetase beta chain